MLNVGRLRSRSVLTKNFRCRKVEGMATTVIFCRRYHELSEFLNNKMDEWLIRTIREVNKSQSKWPRVMIEAKSFNIA